MGTLCTAYMFNNVRPICYITMEHESETFIGAIMLEDYLFCKQVCAFLNKNIGRPIATVGGLAI